MWEIGVAKIGSGQRQMFFTYRQYLFLASFRGKIPSGSCESRIGNFAKISNSSMHHYECVALCKYISLQRGRFCARSLASYIPRSSEDRSSWIIIIQVARGRPGGRLQFSGGGSKMAWLASAFSSVRARCTKKVRRRDLIWKKVVAGW